MTEKKYKLTKESIKFNGKKLYRIEALKDFADVKKGEKGSFIESESNLSHDGDAWVSDNAKVFGNARVYCDARISDNARVTSNVEVSDNAKVSGNAVVYGNAKVSGKR